MKTKIAIQHFGGVAKLAEVLKISKTAIYLWGDELPEGRAFQLEVLTDGTLKAVDPIEPDAGQKEAAA